MRIINKLHKRGLALFMALVMCLSLVQVTALAEDEVVANDVIISEDNTQEENTHEHSYAGTVQAPTCTETGKTVYTCECGDTYDEEGEPATGHTPEVLEAVAPTETETGLTEGSRCAVCDEILTAQEIIPATGVVIPAEVQAFLDAVYALYDVPTEQLLQAVEYAETLYDLLTGEQKALEEVYQCKTALDSFRQTMTLEETVEDTVKDEKSLKEAVAKGGTVKLCSDIALNATLVITGTVALDLNGYTLSLADGKAGSVIKVDGQNIEFTLDDSSIDGTGKITGGKGGSGVPYYGNSGGGICVLNGNLVINGGTITGNTAITYGGGVFFSCSGNFVMNGGKISNNSAVGGGGSLYNLEHLP